MLKHRDMAEVLGNAMGTFQFLDNTEEKGLCAEALRFRVRIDITKLLHRMIHITGPDGQGIRVRLAYERLPNFCYLCGTFGHLVRDCSECFDIAHPSGEVPEELLAYEDWLRTNASAQEAKVVKGSLNRSFNRPPQTGSSSQDAAAVRPGSKVETFLLKGLMWEIYT